MKQFTTTAFILILLTGFLSCKKQNVAQYQDFVGEWSGTDSYANYSLLVSNTGGVTLQKVSGSVTSTFSGKFKLYNNKLKIGTKTFPVDTYPTKDSLNQWSLVLDKVPYTKN